MQRSDSPSKTLSETRDERPEASGRGPPASREWSGPDRTGPDHPPVVPRPPGSLREGGVVVAARVYPYHRMWMRAHPEFNLSESVRTIIDARMGLISQNGQSPTDEEATQTVFAIMRDAAARRAYEFGQMRRELLGYIERTGGRATRAQHVDWIRRAVRNLYPSLRDQHPAHLLEEATRGA